jgi:hypothetical protein
MSMHTVGRSAYAIDTNERGGLIRTAGIGADRPIRRPPEHLHG